MTQADFDTINALMREGLKSAENFNRLYLGVGTLVGVFLGMLAQMWIARRSRASQEGIAKNQLTMQDAVSKRAARDNVSAKRQIWIDELRKDMAEYLSIWQQVNALWTDYKSSQFAEVKPFREALDKFQVQSRLLSIRIRLRLNPTELLHVRLVKLMTAIELRAYGFSKDDYLRDQEKFLHALDLVVRRTQRILKDEWNRIKREEKDLD